MHTPLNPGHAWNIASRPGLSVVLFNLLFAYDISSGAPRNLLWVFESLNDVSFFLLFFFHYLSCGWGREGAGALGGWNTQCISFLMSFFGVEHVEHVWIHTIHQRPKLKYFTQFFECLECLSECGFADAFLIFDGSF